MLQIGDELPEGGFVWICVARIAIIAVYILCCVADPNEVQTRCAPETGVLYLQPLCNRVPGGLVARGIIFWWILVWLRDSPQEMEAS